MSKESPTIMVVEDETLLLQAITKKLKVSGMDVLSCASGQQAVDYLTSMDVLPDAVWLDYYLKDMNGLAFMQELKAKPEWSGIPVIVVSNSASPDKVSNMLALGAKKYILKAEYRLDEIIGMIKEFISDNTTAVAAAATPPAGAGVAAPLAASAPEVAATEPAAAVVASVPESDEPAAPAAAAPVVVDAPAATPVPAETPATSLQAATPEVLQPSAPSPAAGQASVPAPATNDVAATDQPADTPSSQAKPAA